MSKVRVAIFSEPNSLAYSLTEKLLEKSCEVIIISSEVDKWREGSLFHGSSGVLFIKTTKTADKNFDYIVCLNHLFFVEKRIKSAINLSQKSSAKTIFVLPYTLEKSSLTKALALKEKILANKNLFAGILFIGGVIPKKEFFGKGNWLFKLIDRASKTRKFAVSSSEQDLFLLSSDTVAQQITRGLFSLKAYGKTSAVIARPFDLRRLHRTISLLDAEIKIVDEKKETKRVTATADEKIVIGEHVNTKIERLASLYFHEKKKEVSKGKMFTIPKLSNLARSITKVEKSSDKPFRKKDRQLYLKIKRSRKAVFGFLVVLLILFLMPQLMLTGSYISAMVAKKALDRGNVSITKRGLDYSASAAMSAYKYSSLFSKAPLVGSYFKKLGKNSNIFYKSLDVSKRTLLLYDELFMLWANMFNDDVYSPSDFADKIYLELDFLYKELGFLQGELDSLPDTYKGTIHEVVKDSNIADLRRKIYLSGEIVRQIPELLGSEKPKTYLVVLQNNLITRPTGGTIEAFALLTFSQGKLLDSKVYDVSFADSKLKGYVDPPEGLENVPSWYMRDANWDPDFPTSAEKIEWFLDKSLDISVDGVVAIDFEFIEILKEKGRVSLEGSGSVDHGNIYEHVLANIKREDYPYAEKSFYADLLTAFLSGLTDTKSDKEIRILKLSLLLLKSKSAQIFLHNTKAQRAIYELGWDGAIKQENCGDNCFSDLVSVVVADVSKDKSPHYIKKSAKLFVSLEEGLIKKRLKLFFENNEGIDETGEENTQLYIRVLADRDAGFGLVEVDGNEGVRKITPNVQGIRGHKEAGVNLDLAQGESKFLTFFWESGAKYDFEKSGEYRLTLVKQAGTSNIPIELEYNIDSAKVFSIEPTSFLTDEGAFVYNSELSRDFISRIFWQKK
jgi:hypothetical protein